MIQLYPVNGTEFYWGQYLKIDYNVSYPRSFEGKTSVILDGIPAAKSDIIDTKFMFQGRHEYEVRMIGYKKNTRINQLSPSHQPP